MKNAITKGLATSRTIKYKGRKCFCWLIQCAPGSIRVAAVLIRWYSDTQRFYSFYDFFRYHCRTFPIHERVCWARNEHRVTVDSRMALVELVKRTILYSLLKELLVFLAQLFTCKRQLKILFNNRKQHRAIIINRDFIGRFIGWKIETFPLTNNHPFLSTLLN